MTGARNGSRPSRPLPNPEGSQRPDGPRPSARPADSAPPGFVDIPAAQAGAAAHMIRRAVDRASQVPAEIRSAIAVLESAQVTPMPSKVHLIRRPGEPDRVRVPVEATPWLADAITQGFDVTARVDGLRAPADLVALRDVLRRAPLVADLKTDCCARATPNRVEAHDASHAPLSSAQFAARHGCTPARVRRLCSDGRVTGAHKLGRDWIIPAAATIDPPRGTR